MDSAVKFFRNLLILAFFLGLALPRISKMLIWIGRQEARVEVRKLRAENFQLAQTTQLQADHTVCQQKIRETEQRAASTERQNKVLQEKLQQSETVLTDLRTNVKNLSDSLQAEKETVSNLKITIEEDQKVIAAQEDKILILEPLADQTTTAQTEAKAWRLISMMLILVLVISHASMYLARSRRMAQALPKDTPFIDMWKKAS